jgi:hypothetical protein
VQGGKYRILVEGFKVGRQIPDLYSGIGDRGDNVYVSAEAIWLDHYGKPPYGHLSQKTLVYGDLFQSRGNLLEPIEKNPPTPEPILYAGKNGKGLKSGENIPSPLFEVDRSKLARDRLPMLLDETKFTSDSGYVYLPSIWSWSHDNELYSKWQVNLKSHLGEYAPNLFRVLEDLRSKSESGLKITKNDFVLDSSSIGIPPVTIETPKNDYFSFSGYEPRPIGMVKTDTAAIFKPKAVVVNSISADAWASNDDGFGKGILALEYSDENMPGAQYTLFLKIEKME